MPGVDDGVATLGEARHALHSFLEAGVEELVVTPHVAASRGVGDADGQDGAWAALQTLVAEELPGLRLHRGAEVRLDTPRPDLEDPRLRLAGGPAVLVEFDAFTVPPGSDRVLAGLREQGLRAILAHPERYAGLDGEPALVASWRAAGAVLQVNAGSITGRYGEAPRQRAKQLLSAGAAGIIASDFHGRGSPNVEEARVVLEAVGAGEAFRLLTQVNPLRLLRGEPLLPVPPVVWRRGLWHRVRSWLSTRS